MNIHEFQAKGVLAAYDLPVLPGETADTPDEARDVAINLQRGTGTKIWVVKAQIHAGGRGKAGGVILCKTPEEVEAAAKKLLGNPLITHQTGPQGQVVKWVYIETGCQIAKECYLSLVLNRQTSCINFIACASGGMDIEEVAHKTPDAICKVGIDHLQGVQKKDVTAIASCFGLNTVYQKESLAIILEDLYSFYTELDVSMLEINPLVLTTSGDLLFLDAKISFDDNALFRNPEVEMLRDENEENAAEKEARQHDLSYVKLDGTIGCMVNGAGLAMATMDIIKLHGGEPANFLDVGGGADQERVKTAFKIILADKNVKAILINIFGGIMRCDIIAEGIVAAAQESKLSVPLVVRLQGTNKEKGMEILATSGLSITTAHHLDEAAIQAVQAAG
jgi:succinyl-CoA synthetase beta subunit